MDACSPPGMLGIGWCFVLAYLMHRPGIKTTPLRASSKDLQKPLFQVPWFLYFKSPSFW